MLDFSQLMCKKPLRRPEMSGGEKWVFCSSRTTDHAQKSAFGCIIKLMEMWIMVQVKKALSYSLSLSIGFLVLFLDNQAKNHDSLGN